MKFTRHNYNDGTDQEFTVEITDDGEYTFSGDEWTAEVADHFLSGDNDIDHIELDMPSWDFPLPDADPVKSVLAVMRFMHYHLDESTADAATIKKWEWFRNGGSDFPPPEGAVH